MCREVNLKTLFENVSTRSVTPADAREQLKDAGLQELPPTRVPLPVPAIITTPAPILVGAN